MTGERCEHCRGWISSPRRGLSLLDVWPVHLASCPGLLHVPKRGQS